MADLIPIELPEGLFRNGTNYRAKSRWADANLVRWHDGALRPVGGWSRRLTTANTQIGLLVPDVNSNVVRDMFSWRDNSGGSHIAYADNADFSSIDETGTIFGLGNTTVTTAKDAIGYSGYGKGAYGAGPHGVTYDLVGRDITGVAGASFDTWGELLLYASRGGTEIGEYNPVTSSTGVVTNSPGCNDFIVTTNNRQIFAVGTNGEDRRIRTSEVEDRTIWTAAADNQVIDRTLAGKGALLRIIEVANTVLIIGEQDLYRADYIRPPLVWSTRSVADNAGIISAGALANTKDFAVWWGDRNFWYFDGSLRPLYCEVIDYLYENINLDQVSKIRAFVNSQYNEVWWLYQSGSNSEVDSYVYWNYVKDHWNTGNIFRTAAIDKGTFPFVVMVGSDGFLYNHELEFTLPSEGDIYGTTGTLELGTGDKEMCIHQIFPDNENTDGGVTYTFYGKQLPDLSAITFGPYAYSNPIGTTGVAARDIQMRVDFTKTRTEHGTCRLDVTPGGGRG